MNYTVLVGIIQSQTDLDHDRHSIAPVKMSVLVNKILYCDAFDILLNDVSEVALMTYTVHLNDICVIQGSN